MGNPSYKDCVLPEETESIFGVSVAPGECKDFTSSEGPDDTVCACKGDGQVNP